MKNRESGQSRFEGDQFEGVDADAIKFADYLIELQRQSRPEYEAQMAGLIRELEVNNPDYAKAVLSLARLSKDPVGTIETIAALEKLKKTREKFQSNKGD